MKLSDQDLGEITPSKVGRSQVALRMGSDDLMKLQKAFQKSGFTSRNEFLNHIIRQVLDRMEKEKNNETS